MALSSVSKLTLRLLALGIAIVAGAPVFLLQGQLPPVLSGTLGTVCLISLVATVSPDLRQVEWRTVFWGLVFQAGLAIFILKFSIGGWRPGYELFAAVAAGAGQFLQFTSAGSEFVFGGLADQETM